MRHFSFTDQCINHIDMAVTTLLHKPQHHERHNPADGITENALSTYEQKHAASLMRVNHVGEVCAQALYQGQAITARSQRTADEMQHAANEELDHLAWCTSRIHQLNSHTSYLNGLWYLGALSLGLTAGAFGDAWSLGFLAETEQQVVNHLESHVDKLPQQDAKSLAIITQMRDDEAKHRDMARDHGAKPLPRPIKKIMAGCAKIMTRVAYYV
jgi:3-demethoxyubiquinol 3-hydroxylase